MWAPSCPPGPGGWDRRRVGARLRAALAGLRELQGLRATQQARVRGALAMQFPPGPAAPQDLARPENPRGPRAHELRLEAALAALQEQLVRSRAPGVLGARGDWGPGHLVRGAPWSDCPTDCRGRSSGSDRTAAEARGTRVGIRTRKGAPGLPRGAASGSRGRALSAPSCWTSGLFGEERLSRFPRGRGCLGPWCWAPGAGGPAARLWSDTVRVLGAARIAPYIKPELLRFDGVGSVVTKCGGKHVSQESFSSNV